MKELVQAGSCGYESCDCRSYCKKQAEQAQPVAWIDKENNCAYTAAELDGEAIDGLVPLYTAPSRQPLTGKEIKKKWSEALADTEGQTYLPLTEFARAIEAAHGIKGEA